MLNIGVITLSRSNRHTRKKTCSSITVPQINPTRLAADWTQDSLHDRLATVTAMASKSVDNSHEFTWSLYITRMSFVIGFFSIDFSKIPIIKAHDKLFQLEPSYWMQTDRLAWRSEELLLVNILRALIKAMRRLTSLSPVKSLFNGNKTQDESSRLYCYVNDTQV